MSGLPIICRIFFKFEIYANYIGQYRNIPVAEIPPQFKILITLRKQNFTTYYHESRVKFLY